MFEKIKAWIPKHGLAIVTGFLLGNVVLQAIKFKAQAQQNAAVQSMFQQQSEELQALKEAAAIARHEADMLKGQVVVIDSAVNADKKRKARIVKVKESILAELKQIGPKAPVLEPWQVSEIATSIVDNCDEYDIPVPLLLGLIRQESAFNPNAVSLAGAQGLTQVMPTTAQDIKEWMGRNYYDPFKITHNIKFGAYYLNRMLRKFHYDEQKALWAYNAGPEHVYAYTAGVKKLWPETKNYEEAIAAYQKEFEALGIN